MQKKFGFIYVWYDRKRKMYYLGSHLGKETDGYICSSNKMRDAYRRRPDDFKRRIIQRFESITAKELLEEENKWLQLVEKKKERHYNVRFSTSHWTISGNFFTAEIRTKMSEAAKRRPSNWKGMKHSEESKEKMRLANLGNTYKRGKKVSAEGRLKMSIAKQGYIPWNKGMKGVQVAWNKGIKMK